MKNNQGFCFADDTKLISPTVGVESTKILQEYFCRVIDWSNLNTMELHENKSQLLQLPFYSDYQKYTTPKGRVIESSDPVKYLGILDQAADNGYLTSHIEQTAEKKLEKWHVWC